MYQDEMRWWLYIERGVLVSQPTISRALAAEGINQKAIRLLSLNRSEDLREAYKEEMRKFTADELVFIDESLFNDRTGWRHRAYAPIGAEARYGADIRRGNTWSILPAYTVNHGYLPCMGIREGYFNTQSILDWLQNSLFPALYDIGGGRAYVVVLDNCLLHCNKAVEIAIREAGHYV